MVKYLAKFVPHLSDVTESPRIKAQHPRWEWTTDCAQAFINIKAALAKAPVLKYFDTQFQTEGQGDTSHSGIRFALCNKDSPSCMLVDQ